MNVVVLDVRSAARLEAFLIKQGVLFLHVSNVLGVCGGVRVRSHASYAEAWFSYLFLKLQLLTLKRQFLAGADDIIKSLKIIFFLFNLSITKICIVIRFAEYGTKINAIQFQLSPIFTLQFVRTGYIVTCSFQYIMRQIFF